MSITPNPTYLLTLGQRGLCGLTHLSSLPASVSPSLTALPTSGVCTGHSFHWARPSLQYLRGEFLAFFRCQLRCHRLPGFSAPSFENSISYHFAALSLISFSSEHLARITLLDIFMYLFVAILSIRM